ncbi:hypothetical protein M011DRAFT_478016 [Sporormia fimetaria CBS 119925]|uniref:Uncharacterized protein n=1 Tax=Sporormia fimetaria CBS 119925 TaxID=1340428 RepID=A0A6A6V8H3_9PLEO|nr:hypothetical protein M011DRAFT_478016 [Sporormia fimetaria CBS 119925]
MASTGIADLPDEFICAIATQLRRRSAYSCTPKGDMLSFQLVKKRFHDLGARVFYANIALTNLSIKKFPEIFNAARYGTLNRFQINLKYNFFVRKVTPEEKRKAQAKHVLRLVKATHILLLIPLIRQMTGLISMSLIVEDLEFCNLYPSALVALLDSLPETCIHLELDPGRGYNYRKRFASLDSDSEEWTDIDSDDDPHDDSDDSPEAHRHPSVSETAMSIDTNPDEARSASDSHGTSEIDRHSDPTTDKPQNESTHGADTGSLNEDSDVSKCGETDSPLSPVPFRADDSESHQCDKDEGNPSDDNSDYFHKIVTDDSEDFQMEMDIHPCDTIRRLLPRMRNLRVRLSSMCPDIIGKTENGVCKPVTGISSLQSLVVNCSDSLNKRTWVGMIPALERFIVENTPGLTNSNIYVIATDGGYSCEALIQICVDMMKRETLAYPVLKICDRPFESVQHWVIRLHGDTDYFSMLDFDRGSTWALEWLSEMNMESIPEFISNMDHMSIEPITERYVWKETSTGTRLPATIFDAEVRGLRSIATGCVAEDPFDSSTWMGLGEWLAKDNEPGTRILAEEGKIKKALLVPQKICGEKHSDLGYAGSSVVRNEERLRRVDAYYGLLGHLE